MKLFFYKTIFVAFVFFVTFKITIGSTIKYVENRLISLSSKENLEYIKRKIKNELKVAISKDEYIKKEDALLINQFINKIQKDLNNQN
tara:strand:+ start:161 stop:424 length:264 start_codon:yes stop_codon:yes gene_type:complete